MSRRGFAAALGSAVPGRAGAVWFEIRAAAEAPREPALLTAHKFGKLDAESWKCRALGVFVQPGFALPLSGPWVVQWPRFFDSLCATFACFVSGDSLCAALKTPTLAGRTCVPWVKITSPFSLAALGRGVGSAGGFRARLGCSWVPDVPLGEVKSAGRDPAPAGAVALWDLTATEMRT